MVEADPDTMLRLLESQHWTVDSPITLPKVLLLRRSALIIIMVPKFMLKTLLLDTSQLLVVMQQLTNLMPHLPAAHHFMVNKRPLDTTQLPQLELRWSGVW
jgi:hypothetical protein